MIRMRPTLTGYLAKQYALHVVMFMLGIVAVMALFDALELLRRFAKVGSGGDVSVIAFLALLKVPGNLLTVAPFTILFAAIYTLMQMMRRQELVIIRTAGASLWQMLFPLYAVAFMFGMMLVSVINPMSAATELRYQHYEERYLRKEQHMISLLNQGLWLRQGTENGYILLHAQKIKLPSWQMDGVLILSFADDHSFRSRYDGSAGTLADGAWQFGPGTLTNGALPEQVSSYRIPTEITRTDMEESFAAPETISFWALPAYITMLKATGFPVTSLQIHYGSLLLLPVLFAALIMIAAAVTLRSPRQGGQMRMAVVGILLGFVVFFMTNFLHALGASGQIPAFLAACAPAGLTFAAGVMVLLTLEDR